MPNETSTKKHLSATVYYLLTGVAMGWPGLLATGFLLPAWRQGDVSLGGSLATIHILVLGSMLTVAFGVLYQIVPIAFQAPPVPRHVLYWHLPLHIGSVLLMVWGFWRYQFGLVGVGGTLLLLSAIAYCTLIGRSYLRARNKTPVHRGLIWPVASLLLVILVGIFQAFYPAQVNDRVIQTHVLLGGFAFWGGLVLVFSYKLVPMFIISHGYKVSLPRSATSYFLGVALWIASAWIPSAVVQHVFVVVGGLSWLLGLGLYSNDMVAVLRARKKRRIVVPMYDAFLAMLFLVLGQIGMLFSAVFHEPNWLVPSVYLFGFGGLVALMFAYMQKMVPFLWFEYRFSKRPERKTAPSIDDMVPKVASQIGMGLYFVGVLVGFTTCLVHGGARWMVQSSGICMTVGSMFVFVALRRVLSIGGPRPTNTQP